MAQLDPIGQYNRVAYFYSQTSEDLGQYSKDAAASILCRVDYSSLVPPAGIMLMYDFSVDVGSNPPLAVTSASYDPITSCLDFIVSGGVAGQGYTLEITLHAPTNIITNTIEFDVPLTAKCGTLATGVNSAVYPTGLATVFINSAPKYTVSSVTPSGPNIKDQWYDPANGTLYEYITDGQSYWWQQITPATGMTTQFQTIKLKDIKPDGIATIFTLSTVPGSSPNIIASTDLIVSVDSVIQEPDTDYIAFGDQIKFTSIPLATSEIFMTWFAHY